MLAQDGSKYIQIHMYMYMHEILIQRYSLKEALLNFISLYFCSLFHCKTRKKKFVCTCIYDKYICTILMVQKYPSLMPTHTGIILWNYDNMIICYKYTTCIYKICERYTVIFQSGNNTIDHNYYNTTNDTLTWIYVCICICNVVFGSKELHWQPDKFIVVQYM